MVVPSSRGGVPVFSRPSAKPARSSVRESPVAGASPDPAGRNLPLADVDEAAQKRAGGQHDSAAPKHPAVGKPHARHATVRRDEIVDFALDDREIVAGGASASCMAAA